MTGELYSPRGHPPGAPARPGLTSSLLRSLASLAPWRFITTGRIALLLASLVGIVAYGYPFVLPHQTGIGTVATEAMAHAADAPLVFAALACLMVVALVGDVQRPVRSQAGLLDASGYATKLVALLGVLVAVMRLLILMLAMAGA